MPGQQWDAWMMRGATRPHTSTTIRRSGSILEDLPDELLIKIKDSIPTCDLRTHVCFYKCCPRIAALYGDEHEEEAFWMRSFWLSGLGAIPAEDYVDRGFKEAAFDSIERDGFCTHPMCGGNLLDYNARSMASLGLDAAYNNYLQGWDTKSVLRHKLLGGIIFREDEPTHGVEDKSDAHLRPVSSIGYDPAALILKNHPLAMRSFATFPPSKSMTFNLFMGQRMDYIWQDSGLTVWHVQASLQAVLDKELSIQEVIEGFLDEFHDSVPKHFSTMRLFQTLRTPRKMLYIARWDGLRVEQINRDLPICQCSFVLTAFRPDEPRPRIHGDLALISDY